MVSLTIGSGAAVRMHGEGALGEQRIAKTRKALEPLPDALEAFRRFRAEARLPLEVTT